MKTLLLLGVAASAALTLPKSDVEPPAMGSITGTVVWDGDLPKPLAPLQIKEQESEGCIHDDGGMDMADRTLLIDKETKGIANVVFFLEVEGAELEVPEEPIILDQSGCRFEPHIAVVPMGATIHYKNSDETNHNVHTYGRKNDPINKNVAAGDEMPQVLDKAETFEVKCDIHPWMKGYIVVTEVPHTVVSHADGSFEIKDVPPGKYTLSYWHEKLGKGKTAEVEVQADAAAELNVELKEGGSGGGRRRRR